MGSMINCHKFHWGILHWWRYGTGHGATWSWAVFQLPSDEILGWELPFSYLKTVERDGRKDVELLSQLMWSSTANLGGWHPKTWPSEGPLGWTTSSCRSSLECFYVQGVRMVKSRAYEICKVYGRNEAVARWSKACPNRKREWLWINSLCWMNRAKWNLLRKAAAKIKITLNVGPKRQLDLSDCEMSIL